MKRYFRVTTDFGEVTEVAHSYQVVNGILFLYDEHGAGVRIFKDWSDVEIEAYEEVV